MNQTIVSGNIPSPVSLIQNNATVHVFIEMLESNTNYMKLYFNVKKLKNELNGAEEHCIYILLYKHSLFNRYC